MKSIDFQNDPLSANLWALSLRVEALLANNQISSKAQALAMTKRDFLAIPGIGKKSLAEIAEWLGDEWGSPRVD